MSKKLIFFLFAVIICNSIFLMNPKSASAASCTFTYEPKILSQNMAKLTVKVTSGDLSPGAYTIQLYDGTNYALNDNLPSTSENGLIKVSTDFNQPVNRNAGQPWKVGMYIVYLRKNEVVGAADQASVCSGKFDIKETPAQETCSISIVSKNITPETNVQLKLTGIQPQIAGTFSGGYDVCINNTFYTKISTQSGDNIIDLGKKDTASYTVKIKNRNSNCNLEEQIQCPTIAYNVTSKASGGGGQIDTNNISELPGAKECTQDDINYGRCTKAAGDQCNNQDAKNPGIKTAIGCVHTNPNALISDLFKFLLGFSGSIAFLMMVIGAFQMITSHGNPQSLQSGRDRFTSALIGLLFVAFSVLLLQIIGLDILGIFPK